MYGPGAAPPSRNDGTVITLRVLFAVLSVLSCGLLACVPLFRIAMLRGKALDWVLAWVALPLTLALLAVVGSLPEADPRTDVALALVLIIAAASAVHFILYDIRRLQTPPRPPMGPYPPTAPTVGYGYPPQQPQPYAQPTVPLPPHTMPTQTPGPAPAPVPPQNQGQPPQRIDQVRAELDELSDYLRKQDGGR
ncbi:hypothetical protein ABII15_16195 [Streptomyces sp. HUAS MG91]|uniref:Integral membrane protein n=1 Tax=Streptomyces tabacisoli TaxID=3156398 RepID=A0AAU8IT86_9ACTN